MLHVFHGMGIYNFFSNILEYVQISKPIIVFFFKFNNIFPIYIKKYYNYVIKILLLNYVIYIYTHHYVSLLNTKYIVCSIT